MILSQNKKIIKSIILQPSLSYKEEISKLVIIFYNSDQSNKLQVIFGKDMQFPGEAFLFKKQQNFWLIKPCKEEEQQQQLQEIQRIIGISQTIVCLDLSNILETFIEKKFCSIDNELMSSGFVRKLIFVKQIYKDKQAVSEISYFESINKALPFIMESSVQTANRISIADLIQIYECEKVQYVHKVKAIHQKYLSLRRRDQQITYANNLIFDEKKSKSEIKNQIASMKLARQIQNKLLWKLEQLSRFKSWKQEEDKSLNHKFKKLNFLDLNQRISFHALYRFHEDWTANSLQRLKKIFREIGRQSNSSFITEFKKEYNMMQSNLLIVMGQICDPPSKKIIGNMLTQLQNFYRYHNNVIEDSSFGSVKFMKEEAKYVWKYRNNVYKKFIAVILLISLIFVQDSYIGSMAFLILALITLTLRC